MNHGRQGSCKCFVLASYPSMEAGLETFILQIWGMGTGGSVWRHWATMYVWHTHQPHLILGSAHTWAAGSVNAPRLSLCEYFTHIQKFVVVFSVSYIGLFSEKKEGFLIPWTFWFVKKNSWKTCLESSIKTGWHASNKELINYSN